MTTEISNQGIVILVALDHVVQVATKGYASLVGRPPEAMVGCCGLDWIHENDHDRIKEAHQRLLSTGKPASYVRRVIRPNGDMVLCRADTLLLRPRSHHPRIFNRTTILIEPSSASMKRLAATNYVADIAEELGKIAFEAELLELHNSIEEIIQQAVANADYLSSLD